ncbi:MAG: effector-associated domain EAD1-containing protein [Actinomycetota bacterium]|nr:effector-associated domain EAD1-containing protein [Actinomycetota bacterium]
MADGEAAVAVFGNHGGAHSLLFEAGGARAAFERMLMYTDRPPDVEMHELPQIYAAYPAESGYVVQLTEPDHEARRPGMVRTTALLIPRRALAQVSLARVIEGLSARSEAAPVPLGELASVGAPPIAPGVPGLASALISTGAAVWTGPGFEAAMVALWEFLAPEDRGRFVFATAVHPNRISVPMTSDALLVVQTPERCANRWEWPQVSASDDTTPNAAAQALLNPGHPARALAATLLVDAPAVGRWRLLTAAQERLGRLATLSHEETRSLVQLLANLAPDGAAGAAVKERVLARLRELTPAASFADLRGLRHIPWEALGGEAVLDQLLEYWSEAVWRDRARNRDLLAAVAEADNFDDRFTRVLSERLRAAVAAQPGALVEQASAALADPDGRRLANWWAGICSRSQLDSALATAAASAAPEWLAEFARAQQLPETHAAAVPVSDPAAAWQAQLALRRSTARARELLEARVGAAGIVRAAVVLGEDQLLSRAGALIAGAPRFLPRDAAQQAATRAVWAAAIRAGADPWAVVDSTAAAEPLLTALLAGEPVDPILLGALAESPAADLSGRAERARLWPLLPAEPRQRMLTATAKPLAETFRPGEVLPEPELQQSMLARAVLGPLARRDAAQALTILETLPGSGAEHALLVIRNGRFTRADALRLGTLVRKRRWSNAARALLDEARRRPDLHPAVEVAQSLLGALERLRRAVGLGHSSAAAVDPAELREALLELAVELYGQGPAQRTLWERAGGKEADLPDGVSGRERWRNALRAVEQGKRGAPSRDALLKEMRNDYPDNRDLKPLAAALRDLDD